MQIKAFESQAALVDALADATAAAIERAVDVARRASLVVSGGGTPKPLYTALSARALPWAEVDITLADERWVSPHDRDSNQNMLAQSLLQGRASAARFVPLMGAEEAPEDGLVGAVDRLSTLRRPFDVVLLGMGTDGHTASLFPDMPTIVDGLADGASACIAARPVSQVLARISLSAEVLADTAALWLMITGEDKRAVLERALSADAPAPIAAVLGRHPSPVVWWAP